MLPERRDQPIVYAALGDSTVEGEGATHSTANYVSRLHERLRAVYPSAIVVNYGLGGSTSAHVLADQVRRAVGAVPHLVTISVGPNDITTRVPVAAFERQMGEILETLERRTRAVIVVNLLPDIAITPRFSRQRRARRAGPSDRVLQRGAAPPGARPWRRGGRPPHREPL